MKEQRYLGDDEIIEQVETEREKVEETTIVSLMIDKAVEETLRHFGANMIIIPSSHHTFIALQGVGLEPPWVDKKDEAR